MWVYLERFSGGIITRVVRRYIPWCLQFTRVTCSDSPRLRPLSIAKDVIFEEVGEQGIVIHMKDDEVFSLNGTGAFVLRAISQHVPPSQIAVQMTDVYQIDLATAERDVQDFLTLLLERGIIEEVP